MWHLSYAYDNDDNITAIIDLVTAANSRSFGYDSVDRLTRTDGGAGAFAREDYVHDKNGNRTAVERRTNVGDTTPAETDTYNRTGGTNRIASVAPAVAGTMGSTAICRSRSRCPTRGHEDPLDAGQSPRHADGHGRRQRRRSHAP